MSGLTGRRPGDTEAFRQSSSGCVGSVVTGFTAEESEPFPSLDKPLLNFAPAARVSAFISMCSSRFSFWSHPALSGSFTGLGINIGSRTLTCLWSSVSPFSLQTVWKLTTVIMRCRLSAPPLCKLNSTTCSFSKTAVEEVLGVFIEQNGYHRTRRWL